jgi:c-di-GMP-binding flagellar brake protein YcgR
MKKQSSFRIYNRFKTGSKFRAKLILADEVTIKNISFGGILLETTKRLNINTTYRIQIVSSDNNETLTPKGTVVRAALKGQINTGLNFLPLYTVAFKFIELEEREKRFLDKIISEIADNTIFTQEYINMLQANDADAEEVKKLSRP